MEFEKKPDTHSHEFSQGGNSDTEWSVETEDKPMPASEVETSEMELKPCQLNQMRVGNDYNLSLNGGKVNEYRLLTKDMNTGHMLLQRKDTGKSIHIKDKLVKQLQELSEEEKEKRERKAGEEKKERRRKELEQKREEIKKKKEEMKKEMQSALNPYHPSKDNTMDTIVKMIENDIKNIWLVGPAGCGKSTICRMVAEKLQRDIYVMSCGIGTSSTEFVGYKYPEREKTPFAEFYTKKSIIVLDEFTALDPSVAQIANAALANDELYTTTGLINRNDCIIIATSNTFGTGGDMSYVANNQLDASTIDRFSGGIVHVDYSAEYESQFDEEIREFVDLIRGTIKEHALQRIASTRMIIQGEKLKKAGLNWKYLLVVNWTPEEKELIYQG